MALAFAEPRRQHVGRRVQVNEPDVLAASAQKCTVLLAQRRAGDHAGLTRLEGRINDGFHPAQPRPALAR